MTDDNKEYNSMNADNNSAQQGVVSPEQAGAVVSKSKKKLWIAVVSCVLGLAGIICLTVWLSKSFLPKQHKKKAIELLKEGEYGAAEQHIAKSGNSRMWFAKEMLLEREYDAVIAIACNASPEQENDNIYTLATMLCSSKQKYDRIKDDKDRESIISELTLAWLERGLPDEALLFVEQLISYRRPVVFNADLLNELFNKACVAKYGEEVNLFLDDKDGETFSFGSYEQDNNLSNGKEVIKWRVLRREGIDRDGIRILLISDKVLDTCPESEAADLWLNSVFINSAFSEKAQNMIGDAVVDQGQMVIKDRYHQYSDEETKKIFCITEDMLDRYFPEEQDRRCSVTDYVSCSRQIREDSEGYCTWRARKLQYFDGMHMGKDYDYLIRSDGRSQRFSIPKEDLALSGVRPAMIIWIH